MIFNDVSARNIVVGRNATGQDGLFLVDGFGPKQLLPLYAWSKTLNRRRLLRKYEDMVRKLARLGDRLARQAGQPCPATAPGRRARAIPGKRPCSGRGWPQGRPLVARTLILSIRIT